MKLSQKNVRQTPCPISPHSKQHKDRGHEMREGNLKGAFKILTRNYEMVYMGTTLGLRGATRPTRPHAASIRQSFPPRKQRRGTRPRLLSSDWIFEPNPRGPPPPDGHAALELGNSFMPRAKARGAPRTVEFSLCCEFGICVSRLGF